MSDLNQIWCLSLLYWLRRFNPAPEPTFEAKKEAKYREHKMNMKEITKLHTSPPGSVIKLDPKGGFNDDKAIHEEFLRRQQHITGYEQIHRTPLVLNIQQPETHAIIRDASRVDSEESDEKKTTI